MRTWKWWLASASWILGCYGVWSCLALARAGAAADIPQLEAAGAAELTAALAWLLTGCIAVWKLSSSAVLHFANALWSASLAWYYQDETVWLWSGACALLGALAVTGARRGKRRPRPADSV
ncbi:hypothetical protein [Alicyclobacillus acidocaldarius]|uniref:Uncharacterized protein n=1 Tax=Alicyclobacillus acidocaldarius subsp. acidocaldarius (strain ATCC 27009 / DSM 446 / BCRC 14685 / JCM 5260 / KCTC 1825 / NBRC 15652 / NCIMB 11725 / NRRL B-14509 / 104-IA) TaxID=521098 RepID=C8WXF7_ALIAD|nr:hypothetical protein [Alicyclobacillus acidocaldarius]ACV58778.1 hypothetical protein Aaci_1766 [Alicyclobacillus acidocaldarius subsp. acidocaldarius DSM 446]